MNADYIFILNHYHEKTSNSTISVKVLLTEYRLSVTFALASINGSYLRFVFRFCRARETGSSSASLNFDRSASEVTRRQRELITKRVDDASRHCWRTCLIYWAKSFSIQQEFDSRFQRGRNLHFCYINYIVDYVSKRRRPFGRAAAIRSDCSKFALHSSPL